MSNATWLKLSSETLNGMMVAVLLATTASLFLISSGMHETAIIPIVSIVVVMVIGFALVKAFEYFRVEDTLLTA
ncbi:hypothetical protein [Haladaptatus sp. DYF46]|uniref:hypothetical protein n=1 Tax=Haladaptatus sp. DYF46 TaxID=2886041 RepID=UPI001E48A474|nr:hypothetical protein [Haladaptatus sp. DYF46]